MSPCLQAIAGFSARVGLLLRADLTFLGRNLKDMNGEVNPSASSVIPGLLKKKAGKD